MAPSRTSYTQPEGQTIIGLIISSQLYHNAYNKRTEGYEWRNNLTGHENEWRFWRQATQERGASTITSQPCHSRCRFTRCRYIKENSNNVKDSVLAEIVTLFENAETAITGNSCRCFTDQVKDVFEFWFFFTEYNHSCYSDLLEKAEHVLAARKTSGFQPLCCKWS